MKILAIGDPHGKLPKKLNSFVKKNKPDIILCTGDFPDFSELRRIEFKYWNQINSEDMISIIGLQRYKKLERDGILAGVKVLKQLNSFGIPVFIVHGNHDLTNKYPWSGKNLPRKMKKFSLENTIKKLKNITLLEYSFKKFRNYFFYGFGCKFLSAHIPAHPVYAHIWNHLVEKETKEFRKFFKSVDPRKSIILSHDPPFETKLDKILMKQSPRYGEHIGDFVMKEFALKYKPLLWVCGNIHENFGTMKLGKTLVLNAGHGKIGNAALIKLNGKPKVKLLKL